MDDKTRPFGFANFPEPENSILDRQVRGEELLGIFYRKSQIGAGDGAEQAFFRRKATQGFEKITATVRQCEGFSVFPGVRERLPSPPTGDGLAGKAE